MSEARTSLVLWRHGQTDWNMSGQFQGQADVPLNETGVAQAHQAAALLAQMPVSAIVSSPLSRAKVTADTLAERLELPVATDGRLMEIDVGSWEGLFIDDVVAKDPGFARALAEGHDARRSPTGETSLETGERVAACLRDLATEFEGRMVVAASHGLAIRMAVANLLGWDYPTATTLASMHNCGWTILTQRSSGQWKLVSWNQVPVARFA